MNFNTPTGQAAQAIRALMAERRVTVEHLSNGAGVTHSTLKRRLQGISPFNINELGAIAAFFQVDVRVVLTPPSQRRAA